MAVSVLNEDTQDQICDLLEIIQQIEKLKNKDIRIFLIKQLENIEEKQLINETFINSAFYF